MTIQDLAAFSEVVGAIGVIISLVFVAYQLRSNTNVLRAAAYQALHDTEDGFYSDVTTNPDLAKLWELGAKGADSIPEDQRPEWNVMAFRFMYLFQMVHYQRRKGMVDEEFWEAWDTAWVEFMNTNIGMRETYELNKSICTKPFQKYTEQCKTRSTGGRAALFIGGQNEFEK